jgi:hypothetical protein
VFCFSRSVRLIYDHVARYASQRPEGLTVPIRRSIFAKREQRSQRYHHRRCRDRLAPPLMINQASMTSITMLKGDDIGLGRLPPRLSCIGR